MYIHFCVKYPLFLWDLNETLFFSTDFWEILKYHISWTSFQWEPSWSMQMNRQTDITKLIVIRLLSCISVVWNDVIIWSVTVSKCFGLVVHVILCIYLHTVLTDWLPSWIFMLSASGKCVQTSVIFALSGVAVLTSSSEHMPPKLNVKPVDL